MTRQTFRPTAWADVAPSRWLLWAVAVAGACAPQDEKPASSTATPTNETAVVGYLFGARFYPLVFWDAAGFDSERAARIEEEGREPFELTNPDAMMQLRFAGHEVRELARPDRVFQLIAESSYVDRYNEDRPGKYGSVATPLPRGVVVFAYLGPTREGIEVRSDTAGVRSFYQSFARDGWGRHFFESVSPHAPLQTIADSSRIRPHGLTDLDGDGRAELWLTYQLVHGEIGAMVWEQTAQGWQMLAYHCFQCD